MAPVERVAISQSPVIPRPALCGSVEGIEFWLTLRRGQPLRCVVTAAALQSHYGAKGGDEASWFDAFERHRSDIEYRAKAAGARRDDAHVIVLTDSLGQLKVAAGRCGG